MPALIFPLTLLAKKIPTLQEMLLTAKNRIHLMIELKSTGHEKHLVEKQCRR